MREDFVCIRCGLCCQQFNIAEHKPGVCSGLSFDSEGKAVCNINPKPQVCVEYPIHNRTCEREFRESGLYTIN